MTFIPHRATRREMLLGSGALFAWAYMPKVALAEGRDPRFLTIVLRGALDGLATVAPVGDPNWIALRGNDALRLDGANAALPLDAMFALNPAMPNLHRLYKAGQASVVHAVASPYRDRSHFDGQDVLESGMMKPGVSDTGWLNRAVAGLARGERVAGREAFAVGPITPLVARGPCGCAMNFAAAPAASAKYMRTPAKGPVSLGAFVFMSPLAIAASAPRSASACAKAGSVWR